MRLLIGLAALVLVGSGQWAMLTPESFYAAALVRRPTVHDQVAGVLCERPGRGELTQA